MKNGKKEPKPQYNEGDSNEKPSDKPSSFGGNGGRVNLGQMHRLREQVKKKEHNTQK